VFWVLRVKVPVGRVNQHWVLWVTVPAGHVGSVGQGTCGTSGFCGSRYLRDM
jgi:hypothetical protein